MTRKAFTVTPRKTKPSVDSDVSDFPQEILPPQGSRSGELQGNGQTALADIGALTGGQKVDMVSNIVDAVKDTTVAVSSYLSKREETKAAREATAQVRMQTEQARFEQQQLTERVLIEQTEATDRLRLQTYNDLLTLQADLEKHKREMDLESDKSERAHEKEMTRLRLIEQRSDQLRDAYNVYSQLLLDLLKKGETPPPHLEKFLRETEAALVELTRELAANR